MEMRIIISSLGVSIPNTGFSLNAVSAAYLQFRSSKTSPPTLYGIDSALSVGASGKTVIAGHVKTDWFLVDPRHNPWIRDKRALVGKMVNLHVAGTLVVSGRVDLRMSEIAADGDLSTLLKKDNIKAVGFQASDTSIRGPVKWFPSQSHLRALERHGRIPYHLLAGRGAK